MKNSPIVFSFILAALPFLLPVDAVAGMAANAYVTVTCSSGNIILRQDGMTFHLSPAEDPVTITVAANTPYILDAPKNSITIRPHQNVIWSVHSEDGENGIKRANGSIDFCDYVYLPPPKNTHKEQPQILSLEVHSHPTPAHDPATGKKGYNVLFRATILETKDGYHLVSYRYKPCSKCGKTPPASKRESTSFDRFTWKRRVLTMGGDVEIPGDGKTVQDTVFIPETVISGMLIVRGQYSGCDECYWVSQADIESVSK